MKELKIKGRTVPHNFGPLAGANGNFRLKGPCGDTMEFWILVEGWWLKQVMYTTDGCVYSIMAGYAAATLAESITIEQARELAPAQVLDFLGGMPPENEHCARLAVNTLQGCLDDYLNHQTKPTGST